MSEMSLDEELFPEETQEEAPTGEVSESEPPAEEQEEVAASLLMLLKGDAIQRAIAAWHMGWQPALEASGMVWQSPFLAKLLQDPYAQVRLLSYKSLKKMPGFGVAAKLQILMRMEYLTSVMISHSQKKVLPLTRQVL